MSSIILEILCGEIPASMQKSASDAIGSKIISGILDLMGPNINPKLFPLMSSRRLSFYITSLPKIEIESKVKSKSIKGPKRDAAETAIEGFMKKHSISNKDYMEIIDGAFVYNKKIEGKDNILIEIGSIISSAILSYTWKKSMKWGNYNLHWVRPIHSILCLYDNDIIPFFIGHIKSSNITAGHRLCFDQQPDTVSDFLPIISSDNIDNTTNETKIYDRKTIKYFGKNIQVTSSDTYINQLRESYVLVSHETRKNIIIEQINTIIPEKMALIDDADLLNENIALIEFPCAMIGKIPEKYMTLPKEILITTIRNHQKYLLLQYKDSCEIAPYFIFFSDIISNNSDREMITKGNESVLSARLEDAKFIYTNELKNGLSYYREKLRDILIHDEIGSLYDKSNRVYEIAKNISKQFKNNEKFNEITESDIKKVTEIYKADIVTEMVSEFPELQGIIGYYYALEQGENSNIAIAIKDHYLPNGKHDNNMPQTALGFILSIADRLDTLQSMFAIGIRPTSTKDPYALRRAAISINRIMTKWEIYPDFRSIGIDDSIIEFIHDKM